MSALSDALAALRTAVENIQAVDRPERVAELEAAVAAERARYEALVSSEAAEDVLQDEELAQAKAATDAALAEIKSAANEVGTITAQLASVGTAVDEAPAGTPVEDVEVPAPAEPLPPAEESSEAPSPGDGGAVTSEDPVKEEPAETPPVAPPTSGAPTDGAGNPVDAPTV